MRITLKKLEKAKACSRERKRFARLFPNGCELNEKNLRKWAGRKTSASIFGALTWYLEKVLGFDWWELQADAQLETLLDKIDHTSYHHHREEFLEIASELVERVVVLEKRKHKRRKAS